MATMIQVVSRVEAPVYFLNLVLLSPTERLQKLLAQIFEQLVGVPEAGQQMKEWHADFLEKNQKLETDEQRENAACDIAFCIITIINPLLKQANDKQVLDKIVTQLKEAIKDLLPPGANVEDFLKECAIDDADCQAYEKAQESHNDATFKGLQKVEQRALAVAEVVSRQINALKKVDEDTCTRSLALRTQINTSLTTLERQVIDTLRRLDKLAVGAATTHLHNTVENSNPT